MLTMWQTIDTVPQDGTPVLVYLADDILNSRMHVATYLPNIVTIAGHFDFDCPTATHWTPLPDAPK